MTIEISAAIIISVLSLSFSIYKGLKDSKRNETKDTAEQTKEKIEEIKERTRENAVINSKLDLITSSNQEIKEQISSLVKKVDAHGDEIIRIKESLKSAWHEIEEIKEKMDKEDKE